MAKNLVIVESPAKAKTIEKYLGKDYSVKSSFGHIRDLPKKGINIDIENNFEPTYDISADKKKTVAELRKAVKAADTVWLASDEDREGEAIAWHLCEALKLDPKETKRIVFHEITKPAIEHAVANPRTVNMQLVNAQQARRILDRIVGYELSPVLWRKVRPGTSAGRVQSVAVRIIVEREREVKEFTAVSSFKVSAIFDAKGADLPAELPNKFDAAPEAKKFLEAAKDADFTIEAITKKPGKRNPSAPFTTSTLQQEAARRLGFSVKQTMTLAQRLYESGKITYMRTDSTTLSGTAIKSAEEYIKKTYGNEYHQVRQYKTKNDSAQEAHEAIRPTDFKTESAGSDPSQEKLYNLIWRRALASQMAEAVFDRTEIAVALSNRPEKLLAKGEILKFDGFIKAYGGGKDDVLLPELSEGDKIALNEMTAHETFSQPPARYSEASLVRKLEELGIGRPSTYAPTISTVQARGYVEKVDVEGAERDAQNMLLTNGTITETTDKENFGADKNKLVPTSLANVTTDFLVKHFSSVVDYDFTATVEDAFDKIADGEQKWQEMLADFYKNFHPLIDGAADVSREETSQARRLGDDPKDGRPIIARYGRYGPMLQRGETESEDKPDFAPMPTGVDLEDVTFEQAMEMFKLPRLVGQTTDGKDIKANIGRFGPYIQVEKLYVSIKPLDPMTITIEEALEMYADKLQKEKEKHINEFPSGIKVLNGQYGPYVTDGKKNVKIKKDQDPKTITEEEAKEMIKKAPAKKKRKIVRRKK